MSIITQAIANADREARYLSRGELNNISYFFQDGQQRLRIASILTNNVQLIVEKGSQRFWQRCSITPSNSGNDRKTASCQRDQGWYIRLVTYCVLAGNSKPLQDIGLDGMRAMYVSLGVPLANLKLAMRSIKNVALSGLTSEESALAAPYFDELIRAF